MTSIPRVAGYEGLEEIGSGGFGTVYRAVSSYLGQKVAIKVLNGIRSDDPKQLDRFLREGRTMSEVGNVPHIVPILEAKLSEEGRPCLVMPFYEGGNLADQLTRTGPFPADRAVAIGRVIAEALSKVHRRGITHRDIKPDNILVNEDGDVALTDFGLAVTDATRLGNESGLMMTPAHASPERLQAPDGQVADAVRSDVYSLGSTIYTLITGEPPFGTNVEQGLLPFMQRVVNEPLRPITNQPIAPELFSVLQRAMAKRPEERYESAGELADALERVPAAPTAGAASATANHTIARPSVPAAPVAPVAPSAGGATILRGEVPSELAGAGPAEGDGTAIGGQPDAPAGATIIRAAHEVPAAAPVTPETRDKKPVGLVIGAVAVGVLLVAGAVLALTRGDSGVATDASTTTTTSTPVATVLAGIPTPVVEEVRAVPTTGGLSFTWRYGAGTTGQPAVLYEVLVDGKRTGLGDVPSESRTDGLNEVILTKDEVGSSGPVDPATGDYCIQLAVLTAEGRSDRSTPVCAAAG